MSDKRHQHDLDHGRRVQAQAAQQRVEHRVDASQSREHGQDLAQVREAATQLHRRVTGTHVAEQQTLSQRQEQKQRELQERHQAEPATDHTREAEYQAEVAALEHFQETQQAQLEARHQVEQRVLQAQITAVAALEALQRQEREEQNRYQTAEHAPQETRAAEQHELEQRQQAQREQLVAQQQMETRTLEQHRVAVEQQMKRDQGALQQALYETAPGTERQTALKEVLQEQKTRRRELEHSAEQHFTHSQDHQDSPQGANVGEEQRREQERRQTTEVSQAAHVAEEQRRTQVEALNLLHKAQHEQLTDLQNLEAGLREVQEQATQTLQARQWQELADMTLRLHETPVQLQPERHAEHEQLQAWHAQERRQQSARHSAERQVMEQYHAAVQAQMDQDWAALRQVLVVEREASEQREALMQILARQEEARRSLEMVLKSDLAKVASAANDEQTTAAHANRASADYGDIALHKHQEKAIRSEEGVRLSEHEHIRARINVLLQTLDPETGMSPYTKGAYRNSATLTIPRDMAIEKTREDLRLRDRLKEAIKTGQVTADLIRDMDIEADIERTIRARERTIEARKQAGRMDLDDLLVITDAKIIEAAHLQQSEIFHVGKEQRSPIVSAHDHEIDQAVDQLDRWEV